MIKNDVEIRSYQESDFNAFKKMFGSYFRDDFKFEISDAGIEKMCNRILKDVKDEILFLDFMMIEQEPVGFINYQVDSKRSDWCEREGWGFIREMYMDKAYRNRNLGRLFVSSVLNTLKNSNIHEVYLTSDDTGDFFMKCGFVHSGCISEINEDPIYEIKI